MGPTRDLQGGTLEPRPSHLSPGLTHKHQAWSSHGGRGHLVDWGEGSRGRGPVVAKVGAWTPTKGEGADRGRPPHLAHTSRGTGPSESPNRNLALMGIKKKELSARRLQ